MSQASEQIAKQYVEAGLNKKNWGTAMYNVLVEGLSGGGVKDDTAALQSLINTAIAAGRRSIFFPHGTYKVTALTNADQVDFIGDNSSFVGGYAGTITDLGGLAALKADVTQRGINVMSAPFNAKGDGVTDDTAAIQNAITYIMNKGGGTVYFPPGFYLVSGTIYTHLNVTATMENSPLFLRGSVPMSAVTPGANVKNVTVIKKTTPGVMFASNYTPSEPLGVVAYPAVWRSLHVQDIQFHGVGTFDTKYTDEMILSEVIAFEVHLTECHFENCSFYGMKRGIFQPEWEGASDNYCDRSSYRNLAFTNLTISAMNVLHGDATTIDGIAIMMSKGALYGIQIKNANSVSFNNILIAGKSMLRCDNFNGIELVNAHNIRINNLYFENMNYQSNLIYMNKGQNVLINGVEVRHYCGTHIKQVNECRNVKILNDKHWVEEGRALDEVNDNGTYHSFMNVVQPYEYDFDSTCFWTDYDNTIFQNGVHNESGFSQGTVRYRPRIANFSTTPTVSGKHIGLWINYDDVALAFKYYIRNVPFDFMAAFGEASVPTFDPATSYLNFPVGGIFNNIAFASVNKYQNSYAICDPQVSTLNPLKIRCYELTGANTRILITDPRKVGFWLELHL